MLVEEMERENQEKDKLLEAKDDTIDYLEEEKAEQAHAIANQAKALAGKDKVIADQAKTIAELRKHHT